MSIAHWLESRVPLLNDGLAAGLRAPDDAEGGLRKVSTRQEKLAEPDVRPPAITGWLAHSRGPDRAALDRLLGSDMGPARTEFETS